MITEKGTLIIGVKIAGKIHKEFELRPALVRDSIEAVEEDARAVQNESYMGLCLIAKQLLQLGDIAKKEITPAMLMDMNEIDMAEITEANRRLQKRLRRFRGKVAADAPNNSGDATARV